MHAMLAISLIATAPDLEFVEVPVVTERIREDSFLADIVNRTRSPFMESSRPTTGHETTHALNSELRNQRGGGVNAFYVMSGKAVILKEPRLRKREVISFVPPSLRQCRFGTYVSGAAEWDDRPLYLVDEWVSYVNGCFVALDDQRHGRRVEQADWASGPLELGVYCVALGMAVEKYDPAYWRSSQFPAFLRWHWARAKSAYGHGEKLFPSSTQEKQLANLRTSPDAAAMRAFIEKHLDGVWLK
jgi:hypothetical protein